MAEVELSPASSVCADRLADIGTYASSYQDALLSERVERLYEPDTTVFDYIHPDSVDVPLSSPVVNGFNQNLTRRFASVLTDTFSLAQSPSEARDTIVKDAAISYITVPTVSFIGTERVTIQPFATDEELEFQLSSPVSPTEQAEKEWHVSVNIEELTASLIHPIGEQLTASLGGDTDAQISTEEQHLLTAAREAEPWDEAWVQLYNEFMYPNASYTGLTELILAIDESWAKATLRFDTPLYTTVMQDLLETSLDLSVTADGRTLHVGRGTTVNQTGIRKRRVLLHQMIASGDLTPTDAEAIERLPTCPQEPTEAHVTKQLRAAWMRAGRLQSLSEHGLHVRDTWVPDRYQQRVSDAPPSETDADAKSVLKAFSETQKSYLTTVYEGSVNDTAVTLVGGVHSGTHTIESVSTLIEEHDPDVVAVELDPWRYACYQLLSPEARSSSEMGVAMNEGANRDTRTVPIDLPVWNVGAFARTLEGWGPKVEWLRYTFYLYIYAYVQMIVNDFRARLSPTGSNTEREQLADDDVVLALDSLGLSPSTSDLITQISGPRNTYMTEKVQALTQSDTESVLVVVGFDHLQNIRNGLSPPETWQGRTLSDTLSSDAQ